MPAPAPPRDAVEPATILLHKPVGYDAISGRKVAAGLVQPDARWPEDPSGIALEERHFHRLTPLVPLDAEASGLMVFTQDGRVWRRLTEDGDEIEQECIVEVSGDIAPYGLRKLNHGLPLQRPRIAAVQGQLAERDPAALRAEGRAGRPAARHVRAGGARRRRDPAHPHRQGAAGEDARGPVALPACGRALLARAGVQRARQRW